jgi:Tfp pilus assembly protein PilF
MVRLQANDATGAAKILDDVTRREPHNGRAWRTLGLAELQLKNLDRSRDAFQRALAEDPGYPSPMFQLAVIATLQQRKDEAFDWLSKAKATRKIDMTQLGVTPELASMKDDPRYMPLLPTRQDFDNPFVEPAGNGKHKNLGEIKCG